MVTQYSHGMKRAYLPSGKVYPIADKTSTTHMKHAWLAKLTLALGLYGLVLMAIPLGEILEAVRSAPMGLVAAATVLYLLMSGLDAERLRSLLAVQKLRVPLRSVLNINLIAAFYGLFLPGAFSAGAVRWYKLAQREQTRSGPLAAVALSRLLYMLVLIVVGIICWNIDRAPQVPIGLAASLGILLVGLGFSYALFFRADSTQKLGSWLNKSHRLPQSIRDKGLRVLEAIQRCRELSWRGFFWVVLVTTVENLLGIFSYALIALALGIELSIFEIGWIRSAIIMVSAVPITLSGIGLREVGLVTLMAPMGVLAGDAVALSLLVFARMVAVGLVGGLLEAFQAFFRRSRAAPIGKTPRTRLYVSSRTLLAALLKLPFTPRRRGAATRQFERTLAERYGLPHVQTVSSCRMGKTRVLPPMQQLLGVNGGRALELRDSADSSPTRSSPRIVSAVIDSRVSPSPPTQSNEAARLCSMRPRLPIRGCSSPQRCLLRLAGGWTANL